MPDPAPQAAAAPVSPFAGRGRSQALTGAQPWLLHDPEAVWYVDEGEVDVFALRTEHGEAVGARYSLFRIATGQILIGMTEPAAPVAAGVLAAATGNATVVRLARRDLLDLAADPQTRQTAAALVRNWIEGLSVVLPSVARPLDTLPAPRSGTLALADGRALDTSEGLVCVRVTRGAVRFDSAEGLPLTPESGWAPLATCSWVLARGDAELEMASLDDLMAQGDGWWSVLDAFHRLLRDGLVVKARVVHEKSLRRVQERDESLHDTFAHTLARQSAVLDAQARASLAFSAKGDDLLAACQILGARLDIAFRPPPSHTRTGHQDPIKAIARAARVRVRPVTLLGDWWRRDHGPLLGFFGAEKKPVALVPASPRRYLLVDPATLATRRVTPELAAQVDPAAHLFYRPLPEGAIHGWDIIRYALRGQAGDVWMVIGMGLLGGLLSLVTPLMTEMIFNTIIPAGELGQLAQIGAGFVVAALAGVAFSLTKSISMLRLEGRSDNALQAAVWDRVLALPAAFFRRFSAGDLANRVMGINVMRQMLSGTVLTTILTGVFSVFNLLLIFYYSWKLAILAVILVFIASAVTYVVARTQLKYQRASMNLQGKTSGLVFQLISAIAKLRDTACEARAFSLWSDQFLRKKALDVRATRIANFGATFNAAYPVLCLLATFAVYYFFLKTDMKTGDFLAYNAAFTQFLAALLGMSGSFIKLVNIRPIYERAKPIFDEPLEVDASKADPGPLQGRIDVTHVSFRYRADGPLVLRDVSLTIRPGEFAAIVGPSGAGKSTLFRLLLGFETPESGDIAFDGQNLRNLDLRALRRQISVVLQNGQVFSGDIFHNIVGAASGLTLDDAWAAAEAAAVADDIRSLPMGMYTYIPENGATLSGGQRQRLMIARAIASRPGIVFFDEATSSMDNRAQAVVSQSLKALKATRVIVAQRLSTVQDADTIYVVDAGRIVQKGSFQELMDQPGLFQDLARRQLV
jgi:ATP-binding cassette subfamily C protein